MPRVTLPIGTSDFAEIRREGWYYVDKTGLIRDLLNTRKAQSRRYQRQSTRINCFSGVRIS